METDVLIIGGGLAGLVVARRLQGSGVDFRLVEARDRLGGRILTEEVAGDRVDLGPAWVWVGQTRIAALAEDLRLELFAQNTSGDVVIESENEEVFRRASFASAPAAYRFVGGSASLVEALTAQLPSDRIGLGRGATALRRERRKWVAQVGETEIVAGLVLVAIPPRLAVQTLDFGTALSDAARRALAATPTWMAGQAKFVAVYERPFWREAGLSGDAFSHRGPLVQIHDASPAAGGGALFGFLGVSADARAEISEDALRRATLTQLERLFGQKAGSPRGASLKDWARDPQTAVPLDAVPLRAHPVYGPRSEIVDLERSGLFFAGAELAKEQGGLLEGAVESAEATSARVLKTLGALKRP